MPCDRLKYKLAKTVINSRQQFLERKIAES